MPFGQWLKIGGGGAVVLDKYVVPDLDNAAAVAVDFADMSGHILHSAKRRSEIVMDLATGSAGTGFCHFPEIILASPCTR